MMESQANMRERTVWRRRQFVLSAMIGWISWEETGRRGAQHRGIREVVDEHLSFFKVKFDEMRWYRWTSASDGDRRVMAWENGAR
ncbi:hypothetical protein AB6A40_008586 [Gnathostoma spinigerum]|uniref:Uncharacterized protein n=1 Tax=Gnathostoma spinigerum TaxID=75299 RepID=A0ABD6EZ31_9BILA